MTTQDENKAVAPSGATLLPGEKPTLKTIARLSGMAVPTVSRALSDAPDISAETKKKVRRIADQIGYVPNRAGVRLRTGRTNVIALVLSTEHDVMNMTARLISSIAVGLRDTPFHLVVTPDFPDEDPLKAIKYIVETGSADAVIINRIEPEDPRVRYLIDRGFPFATHGRSVWADQHSYYDYDNHAFGRIAVEQLVRRCRTKLLMLAPPLDQNYAREMIEGAQNQAAQSRVELQVAQGVTSDAHRDEIQDFLRTYLGQHPATDGLISASPNATMAAIAGIESVGISLGDGLDVFSKETVPFLTLFRPSILCISEDVSAAGAFLANAAVHAAQNPGAPALQHLDAPPDSD